MNINRQQKRVLSLGILCFQGFGLRIFEGVLDGAIVLWTCVLLLLNWQYATRVPKSYWVKMGTIAALYVLFCIFKGVEVVPYLVVAWMSAAIVLTPYCYGGKNFVEDLRKLTRFCLYYGLCHIPIMLFFHSGLITTDFGMHPKTFLYLFYFNQAEGLWGLNRIQGFCWEPSCWNLLLNLNLVFTLYYKDSLTKILLSILAIVSVMSTTGVVVMAVIIISYFVMMMSLKRKTLVRTFTFLGLFGIFVMPFILQELENKLNDGSGNARMGDFAIAKIVATQSPLMGADLDNITSNREAMRIRDAAWTVEGDYEGYMNQGMVNSFAALFVEWGLPITLLLFYLMYKTPLIEERKLKWLFIITILCVLMGTPIARTGFFYLFSLSTILFGKKKVTARKSKSIALPKNKLNDENIHNYCNLQRRKNVEELP